VDYNVNSNPTTNYDLNDDRMNNMNYHDNFMKTTHQNFIPTNIEHLGLSRYQKTVSVN